MSKQHLSDMLKSMANNDLEGAKAHFSKYASEKTQEILARGDTAAEPAAEPETPPAEPEVPEVTPEPNSTTE